MITIVKKKAKAKKKAKMKAGTYETPADVLADKIDQLAKWDALAKEHQATLAAIKKDLDAGMKDLVGLVNKTHSDDTKVTIKGKEHSITFGIKSTLRSVTDDREAVIAELEKVDPGLALALAKFGLGDLDKYLTPPQVEKLVTVKRGGRSSKFLPLF